MKRLIITCDDLLFGGENLRRGDAIHLVSAQKQERALCAVTVESETVRADQHGVDLYDLCPNCLLILIARADIYTYRIEATGE